MKNLLILGVAVVMVGGLAGGSTAGVKKIDAPVDDAFLMKAADWNKAAIDASKIAERQASSVEVKNLATHMVKEHTECYEKLATLLKTRKVGIVSGTDPAVKEELKRLAKHEGAAFDRAYMECVVKEHRKAIGMFETQGTAGKQADIRTFAAEALPTLRQHLTQAEKVQKALPQQ